MANWKHKIAIGHLLTGDDSDEHATFVAKEVAKLVGEAIPMSSSFRDFELTDIVNCLNEFTFDCDEFNYQLGRLYDWGDANHRLWIDTFTPPIMKEA